jgi:hypothetical protein
LKYCDHFNCRKLGYRANGVGKSLDILVSNMLCNTLEPLVHVTGFIVLPGSL